MRWLQRMTMVKRKEHILLIVVLLILFFRLIQDTATSHSKLLLYSRKYSRRFCPLFYLSPVFQPQQPVRVANFQCFWSDLSKWISVFISIYNLTQFTVCKVSFDKFWRKTNSFRGYVLLEYESLCPSLFLFEAQNHCFEKNTPFAINSMEKH